MISFRYHIVSIVSVFLALAVGIALGGGPLKGEVDDTLVRPGPGRPQGEGRAAERDRRAAQHQRLQRLFRGHRRPRGSSPVTSTGRVVSLVALPGAAQNEVDGAARDDRRGRRHGRRHPAGRQRARRRRRASSSSRSSAASCSTARRTCQRARRRHRLRADRRADRPGHRHHRQRGSQRRRPRREHPGRAQHGEPDVRRRRPQPARQPGDARRGSPAPAATRRSRAPAAS